jgi:hypothetical protein
MALYKVQIFYNVIQDEKMIMNGEYTRILEHKVTYKQWRTGQGVSLLSGKCALWAPDKVGPLKH